MARNGAKRNGTPNTSLDWLFEEENGSKEGDANYNEIEPSCIATLVWSTVHLGGNVQFGATKDGRTYVLKFFFGTPKKPMYFSGTQEGRAEIAALADKLLQQAIENG